MFDVIIIGAGPAGASAAREIAQAGWRVALLERRAYGRQRAVCDGGVQEQGASSQGSPNGLLWGRLDRRGVGRLANAHSQ